MGLKAISVDLPPQKMQEALSDALRVCGAACIAADAVQASEQDRQNGDKSRHAVAAFMRFHEETTRWRAKYKPEITRLVPMEEA